MTLDQLKSDMEEKQALASLSSSYWPDAETRRKARDEADAAQAAYLTAMLADRHGAP